MSDASGKSKTQGRRDGRRGQTHAELIFVSDCRGLARGRTRLCKSYGEPKATAWLEAPGRMREISFSLGGIGPPGTRGGSFHEANGGDEGVKNTWVLSGAGSIAQGFRPIRSCGLNY
jgi:hypothetical protein